MFRFAIFSFFFLISFRAFSQKDSIGIIGPSAGTFEFNSSVLNTDLKTNGSTGSFASAYTTIGINLVGPVRVGSRYKETGACGAVNFDIILPQTVRADSAAISNYHFQGWQLMTSLWGCSLVHKKNLGITIAPGVEWGNIKVRLPNVPGKPESTNFFIAPLARFEVRVSLGNFAAGFRATYRYDISNPKWINDINAHPLPDFRNSGYGLQLYIGYVWRKN